MNSNNFNPNEFLNDFWILFFPQRNSDNSKVVQSSLSRRYKKQSESWGLNNTFKWIIQPINLRPLSVFSMYQLGTTAIHWLNEELKQQLLSQYAVC